MKVCAARKCQSWVCLQMTQLQCPMGCHGHHAILCNPNRYEFLVFSGPIEQLSIRE